MKKQRLFNILYCGLIALIFLTICSKNSFLYRINDWWDAQAFFTVGKGMMKGIIPYRDLFEQKGIILYLIYGLSSLISSHSFIGVYFFEIGAFTIFLYYAQKTMLLYLKESSANWGLILLALAIIPSSTFGHGGSAEEFVLPLFMISIYHLVKYFNEDKMTKGIVFLNGVLAGMVLWIKYSLLGFWFIWAAAIILEKLFHKNYKEAIYYAIIFLTGMGISSLPWLIYFSYHHALKDLVAVYFLFNATSYSQNISILAKLLRVGVLMGKNLLLKPAYLLGITIPLIIIWFKRLIKRLDFLITIILSLLLTGLGTFIGGKSYFYYGLILAPFIIIGCIVLGCYIEKKKLKINGLFLSGTFIIALIIATIGCQNTYMIKYPRSAYAQYTFADIIGDQKLLNYNFLDGGFYFTTEQIPSYYYFMRNNVSQESYPQLYEEQIRYIVDDKPTYIVTKTSMQDMAKIPDIKENYLLIKSHTQKYEKRTITYYLYQKKKVD